MIVGRRSLLVSLLGVCLLGANFLAPPFAQAQGTESVCAEALETASNQYLEGAFEEALRVVSACLNQRDVSQEQAVSAYRLLALIYLKKDELENARGAVLNLLAVDPEYTADPVTNPPAYTSLVSLVRQNFEPEEDRSVDEERRRRPFFRRTSTWITLSSIVVGSGVATYFATTGSGDGANGGGAPPSGPGDLPIPPGTPGN